MTFETKEIERLQGEIEALHRILVHVIGLLPEPGLQAVELAAQWQMKWIEQERDTDPDHINRREPSTFSIPPVRLPPITLYAAGALDTLQRVRNDVDTMIENRRDGASETILASTPEADERLRRFREDLDRVP